jgi:hypothetical protein
MNRLLLALLLINLAACGSKKKPEADGDPNDTLFPVTDFIKSQVRHVDTSLYRIIAVETVDTVSTTTFVRREDFRKWAKDFIQLPDISKGDLREDYDKSEMFDEVLDKVIFTYTSKDREHLVQREDVTLAATNESGTNEVNEIIIKTSGEENDSEVEKTMVWYTNKRFTVVTKIQKGTQPQQVRKLEVIWNDFNDQQYGK